MLDPDYDLFVEIVDCGSISGAAQRLRISPASVSKRLARVERKLATRLIHRTTRRLALTAEGRRFHQELLAIRAALAAAEDRLTGRTGEPAGSLHITAPTSFGRMYIAPCLPEFLARYPDVELNLDLSDSFVDLFTSRYDLAIRIASRIDGGLEGHRLAPSPRVLCAAPGYLAAHGRPQTLADLAGHHLLAAEGQLPWHLDGPEGAMVHVGASIVATNSSEVVRELAIGGSGIALRSTWDVAPLLATGALVRILPQYEGSRDAAIFAVHTATPRLAGTPRAMITHLQSHFAAAGDWDALARAAVPGA